MTKLFRYLFGYVVVQLCGASVHSTLNLLSKRRIPFWNTEWVDELTVCICICEKDLSGMQECCEKSMCDWRCIEKTGARYSLHGLQKRPVLVGGLIFGVLLSAILPMFVLFYQVSGNQTVPQEQILRELRSVNVGFGTFGPNIHPQWIKDHLLQTIPQLQWITVVQNGCRAQVIVRERKRIPETEDRKAVSHIVASRGGIITSQSVLAGQAMQNVGDTVTKGQLLVSGFVDLDRTVLLQHANAEIYARTWYENTIATPERYISKVGEGKTQHCVWLRFGEKRIKLYGNSGIYHGSCDKMINNMTVTMPGGLELPICLEIQSFHSQKCLEETVSAEQVQTDLGDFLRRQLLDRMIAGEIVHQDIKLTQVGGCYQLHAVTECHEMIARSVDAEW